MILYKFGYDSRSENFDVRKIEVEEKEKCYVAGSVRVLKSEINKLTTYDAMFCLDDNPSTFIDALAERTAKKLRHTVKRIANYKNELKKFEEWKKDCK